MSIWGRNFTIDIFGESHGEAIGVVISGLAPGLSLDIVKINDFLARRKSGTEEWSTKRGEDDEFRILSGVYKGFTTGAPLCALCGNNTARPDDYPRGLNRPGHADYTGSVRYGGFNDPRGGGVFSGRLTAPVVFAGAVASIALEQKGIYTAAHIKSIAGVKDDGFGIFITREEAQALKSSRFPLINESVKEDMLLKIKKAADEGDSVGGTVECAVLGAAAGFGSEYFGSAESALSSVLFAIPAVKAVSFGAGFKIADMRGSEANDEYVLKDGKIAALTNNNGGILGGITNGMPIVFEAAVKPTPSIARAQKTVNIKTMEPETIEIHGRHDPCIVPRAVPVIEAAACIAVLDIVSGGR